MRLLLICATAQMACKAQSAVSRGSGGPTAEAPHLESLVSYPRARWRLVPAGALDNVVVWVSHILIRHAGSDRRMPFAEAWQVEPNPPTRSRDEALALASSVAARAQDDPASFARLAREYSEDVVTRESGGSLGGVAASRFAAGNASLLDALAAIGPGQVSHPVETSHGFEILLRRPVPRAETVAARRVVVPYDGTYVPSTGTLFKGRSRSEAEGLARDIVRAVRADAREFDRFLERYPPSADEPGGFIGVWSNQEPGHFEREREWLAGLQPGEVTDAIDSAQGFEVFVRTPSPPDPGYAVQVIQLAYAPRAPTDDPRSREATRALAQSIAAEVTRVPARFEALQARYCCAGVERWSSGRKSAALVEAASKTPVGGVWPDPLELRASFVIVRRVDLAMAPNPAPRFDIPLPDTVDVSQIAANYSGPGVQKLIRDLGADAAGEMQLSPPVAARVKTLHEDLAAAFARAEPKDSRERAVALFFDGLSQVLPEADYVRYRQLATTRVSEKLMQAN